MHLLPREHDKLLLHQAGFLAQKRLARGLQLNINEAIALIASQLQEFIRDGECSVLQIRELGKKMLGRRHVLPSVPWLLHDIQVEGTFKDGVFLVSVEDPICTFDGNLEAAFHGSGLCVPSQDLFPAAEIAVVPRESIPGAIIPAPGKGRITINAKRKRIRLCVTSYGNRDIQVGSHYHFAEINGAFEFDRVKANGMRLDKAAGTAVRFEPGESKYVTLCEIAGNKIVTGGNSLVTRMGDALKEGTYIEKGLLLDTFRHCPEDDASIECDAETIGREEYISMYGPTTGDRIRLGDTSLWVEIESDAAEASYGDEVKFGGGKTIREGMGQMTSRRYLENHLDLVITNAVIIDCTGIIKADIGVKNGKIVGIGKAGNPDVMANVCPNLYIGSSTEVIAGEKLIVTAGAIDAHVHYICPQQVMEALAAGTTTMIGGGTGPATGSNATTCTPSPFYMKTMLAATDGLPMNFAFTGKGSDAGRKALEDIVRAGAAGLKLHEDWGATPAVISTCLDVGDEFDVQVNIHTDTLNESGFVENTIDAFGGRTIHTYHTEGAGGGHAPDIIAVCGLNNVLPSSTNPTRPLAKNTVDEHLDMLIICHHLDKTNAEDMKFASSRIRESTIAAEDILQDTGAISMISSDSQAMGRVGEVVSRTWRTASKLKDCRGPLKEKDLCDTDETDNGRVRRYVAKYTINPAITHGISHLVGSVEVGKLADLVLWKPENFGAKPEIVLKSGVIVWAQMGDVNGSIPIVQPTYGRPMWGSFPAAAALNSVAFVSRVSIETGTIASYGLSKRVEPVFNCRNVTKKHMKLNCALPKISVDPETYEVTADNESTYIKPACTLPLGKEYNFF